MQWFGLLEHWEPLRFVLIAVIVAIGVSKDGRRELLGMEFGVPEAEPFWTAFLRKLMRRGLRGGKLVVSVAHEGMKAAALESAHLGPAALPGASHA